MDLVIISYLMLGIISAIYFVIKGFKKLDPLIESSPKYVRVLLFPGAILLWPWLLSLLRKK